MQNIENICKKNIFPAKLQKAAIIFKTNIFPVNIQKVALFARKKNIFSAKMQKCVRKIFSH